MAAFDTKASFNEAGCDLPRSSTNIAQKNLGIIALFRGKLEPERAWAWARRSEFNPDIALHKSTMNTGLFNTFKAAPFAGLTSHFRLSIGLEGA